MKKVRVYLTYLAMLIIFVGSLSVEATTTGEKATLLEAIGMSSIVFVILYIGFSDWMYDKYIDCL